MDVGDGYEHYGTEGRGLFSIRHTYFIIYTNSYKLEELYVPETNPSFKVLSDQIPHSNSTICRVGGVQQ